MRTKVQFDFYELPVESYAALRDSMLNHIDRRGGWEGVYISKHNGVA